MRLWQDTVAEGLLYLAVVVIGLTAADAVVNHVSADLARLLPSYEPIVSIAVLISMVVTALILTSLWLKTCATRRRVRVQQHTMVSGLSRQHGGDAPPVSWKRTRESA